MKHMDNCIFCKIARGEISAQKTYDDEAVMAFLDIHPKAPGHTLVVPKEHYRWFHQMPDDLTDQVFRASKKIAQALSAEHNTDYIRLSVAGDEVPHVHVHLIPSTL